MEVRSCGPPQFFWGYLKIYTLDDVTLSQAQTADTMYNIALVHKRLHNYTKCRECFESAAFQMEQFHGKDHPEVLDARRQMERARELQADRAITVTTGVTSIGSFLEQEETSMDAGEYDSNV